VPGRKPVVTLVRHEFGPEGIAYLRTYLASNDGFGKRLGRLLGGRNLDAGTTWAFVPAGSSRQKRVDFQQGGSSVAARRSLVAVPRRATFKRG